MSAGITLATAASVMGIAVGANALLGGGGGSGGGGAASGAGSTTYDPYSPYRGEAASQLNSLMNNPSAAMSTPGYQQQLQAGTQASQRGAAATGQLQSGGEQAALGQIGQNTFGSYYNSMLANLMQMSGATQNPASAAQAAQQGSGMVQQQQQGSLQNTTSGLGGLANLYGGGGGYNHSSVAGYGNTSAYTNYAPTAAAQGGWGIE